MPAVQGTDSGARELGNVLVSSAGWKIPLVRSVKDAAAGISSEIKVFAADSDPGCPAGLVVDGLVVLPSTVDENRGEIRDRLVDAGVRLAIPTRDGELTFWAAHRDYFAEAGVDVVVSTAEAVETTIDKRAFATYGERHGIPVIPVIPVVDSPVGAGLFVVKERRGAASASIGMRLDAAGATSHARTLADPLIQPFIAGLESSADAWFDRHHSLKGLVLRRRELIVNGESRITTTYRDAAVETELRRALETFDFRGPVIAQFLRDESGGVHLIEVNARFGGASTASIGVGLDVWRWSMLESFGFGPEPFLRRDREIRQIRVPGDLQMEVGS